MNEGPMYHGGSRRLQDRFDSRRIADRLEEVTVHDDEPPTPEWKLNPAYRDALPRGGIAAPPHAEGATGGGESEGA